VHNVDAAGVATPSGTTERAIDLLGSRKRNARVRASGVLFFEHDPAELQRVIGVRREYHGDVRVRNVILAGVRPVLGRPTVRCLRGARPPLSRAEERRAVSAIMAASWRSTS
jgi:hypothetical protein